MFRDIEPKGTRRRGAKRRWPAAAMAVGLIAMGGSTARLLDGDSSALDKTSIPSGVQLTVGEMDKMGKMHSRNILWQGHQEIGLGSGYEHHATLTISRQKSIIEPNLFVLSFASAPDMTDLYNSRNLKHVTATLRERSNSELERKINLKNVPYKDTLTGKIKNAYEAQVVMKPNKTYDTVIEFVDPKNGDIIRVSYSGSTAFTFIA